MKKYIVSLILAVMGVSMSAQAAGPGFVGECWQKQFYFYGPLGKGALSGKSAANAKPISDTNVMAIEAGSVIEKVYVVIDTALVGTSLMTLGDTDSANGFMLSTAPTLSSAGLYNWDVSRAGAYLRSQSLASGGSDIYVVPSGKFYSAAGKYITLDVTTTNVSGAFRVVVEGCKVGS